MTGICECGCGRPTTRAAYNNKKHGYKKGEFHRFATGHNGKRASSTTDYRSVWLGGRQVKAHVAIVEAAMGRPLPATADVHHVNGQKWDNRPENLVACEDRAYHMLLHMRQRALEATGHADWRKCSVCKDWASPTDMQIDGANRATHPTCMSRVNAERYRKRRDAAGKSPPQISG
jgi:HNH endonuclease